MHVSWSDIRNLVNWRERFVRDATFFIGVGAFCLIHQADLEEMQPNMSTTLNLKHLNSYQPSAGRLGAARPQWAAPSSPPACDLFSEVFIVYQV